MHIEATRKNWKQIEKSNQLKANRNNKKTIGSNWKYLKIFISHFETTKKQFKTNRKHFEASIK